MLRLCIVGFHNNEGKFRNTFVKGVLKGMFIEFYGMDFTDLPNSTNMIQKFCYKFAFEKFEQGQGLFGGVMNRWIFRMWLLKEEVKF